MNILHATTDPPLLQRLKEMLGSAAKADIAVGYFFMSGFEAVAQELSPLKEIRILVGRTDRHVLEEVAAGCVDYSVVPLEEAMAAGMLAEQGGRPTWFRDLTPEPVAVEEEEAAPEAEEPAPVVVAEEPAPVVAEGELVGLESLEGREEEEA